MSIEVTMRSICLPSDDVVSREIEGETIIVPLTGGIGDADDELYTLNDTGQAIWRQLDGRRTLAEVAVLLTEQFEADPAEIEADVLGFASEMVKQRILTVRQ